VQLPLAQQRGHQAQVILSPAPSRSGKIHAPLPIRIWHLASFDAPAVAILWCAAFAWAAHVILPWWVLTLIPLGVWPVYIADRLLDARRGIESSDLDRLRDRHVFHWRHRCIFIPLAIGSALAAACIISVWMPQRFRENDSLLAAASLAYFARVHSKRNDNFAPFSKEFFVGTIFTIGCVLPTWSRARFSSAASVWPLVIATAVFACLAWLNCAAINRWESGNRFASDGSSAQIGFLLACASGICASLLVHDSVRIAGLLVCAVISALLLAFLDRYCHRLTPVTLRSAADLVLLTPAVLLVSTALIRR